MICFSVVFVALVSHLSNLANALPRASKPSLPPYLKPKTVNQIRYQSFLTSTEMKLIFVLGPAGSGKTTLACVEAAKMLKEKKVDKIILSRPTVTVENENLGYLPGSINDKMDPWTRPFFDILQTLYTPKDIATMLHEGVIEVSPIGYMRGRTFHNAYVIADEMQNSSPGQMKMLLTRIGSGSKLVVAGDIQQSDIPGKNGLEDVYDRITKSDGTFIGICLVQLDGDDIVRDPVIVEVLRLYDDERQDLQTKSPALAVEKIDDSNNAAKQLILSKKDNDNNDNNDNMDCALIPLKYISKDRRR